MSSHRDEVWGRLVYEKDRDEFEAEVRDDVPSISIDRPISAGCLVTGKCNLKCQYCYGNDESLPADELSVSDWARIFARLRSWGVMRVDLSGGEPTVRRDIREIAAAALDVNLSVVVSTNGLPLVARGLSIIPPGIRLHISIDSGLAEVHESSRVRRNLLPYSGSLQEILRLTAEAVAAAYRVRVLTCIGRHNSELLFELGESLALIGVEDWNISRVLAAGRAQCDYHMRWDVDDLAVLEQVSAIREAFPWMRVRYSNRTSQDGYFLLVLPNGDLATQYTDHRDKVVLGPTLSMTVEDLRRHQDFNLCLHACKWVSATIECQEDSLPVG